MSLAWTTVLVIALLLPGVFVLVGFAASERHSREVVRTSAVGDVALALLLSIILHLLAGVLLALLPIDYPRFFRPFAYYNHFPPEMLSKIIRTRLWKVLIYIIATAGFGLWAGWTLGRQLVRGRFRFLATHRWIYDMIRFSEGVQGTLRVFIVTSTVENNKALMYKGYYEELFLRGDGRIAYIVLYNCTKFFMDLTKETPVTGTELPLSGDGGAPMADPWNRLLVDGDNIANIYFDKSPGFISTPTGEAALEEELAKMGAAGTVSPGASAPPYSTPPASPASSSPTG
ncbi:MAG TPA: hypothetical protein VF744_10675 [Beijerinckiaceae bacterium]|jgi:hypothetical protein